MGNYYSKGLAICLMALFTVMLGAALAGCSSSSGTQAASSAGAVSSSASSSTSEVTASSSAASASEESAEASSEEAEDSEAEADGAAFVGAWEATSATGRKLVFELNADGTGRVLVYDGDAKQPVWKDSCSWKASSKETGSIWVGANITMKLVQNGEAVDMKGFLESSERGSLGMESDEIRMYKQK